MGRIVVGVDGSEQSEAALRWAVDEARLRGARVEAVHVYEPAPMVYAYAETAIAPDVIDQNAQSARQDAAQLLDAVLGRIDAGEVVIEPVVVDDIGPAQALVRRSQDAELLVVGSRGRGGFQELLLGSVSHQCANHAAVPWSSSASPRESCRRGKDTDVCGRPCGCTRRPWRASWNHPRRRDHRGNRRT